jgi:20S proteasome alpha/beta subunit
MENSIVVFATSSSENKSLIKKHNCEKIYEINRFLVTTYDSVLMFS